jgi:ABC-2 type transport system permease protein
MNEEIREGTLALRLLRPVHPLFAYAVKSLAELPVRGMLAVPIAGVALFVFAGDKLTRDPVLWAAFVASVFGGWMITLLTNIAIGCLALFIDSSAKVMDAWTSAFFVFSGYMIPVELFPRPLQIAADWLPFRYQLGLPVELMTGAHDRAHALAMLGRQWLVVAVLSVVVTLVWRRGLRRFDAFGG